MQGFPSEQRSPSSNPLGNEVNKPQVDSNSNNNNGEFDRNIFSMPPETNNENQGKKEEENKNNMNIPQQNDQNNNFNPMNMPQQNQGFNNNNNPMSIPSNEIQNYDFDSNALSMPPKKMMMK